MRCETNKRAREETVRALSDCPVMTQEIANGFQQILTILLIEEEMSRQSAEEQKQRTRENQRETQGTFQKDKLDRISQTFSKILSQRQE